MYWQFREALDPNNGHDVKLPPNSRLKAQLTAVRYEVRGTDIVLEPKEDVEERIGGSLDESDATVMAWLRRTAVAQRPPRRRRRRNGVSAWAA
jgi:hypothetical protein